MIKPGTLCMIRGVPKDSIYEANGRIVTVVRYIGDLLDHKDVHEFTPPVVGADKHEYSKCKQQWLHPLDPCEDDLARETLERLEDEMRAAFINTVLEKI